MLISLNYVKFLHFLLLQKLLLILSHTKHILMIQSYHQAINSLNPFKLKLSLNGLSG